MMHDVHPCVGGGGGVGEVAGVTSAAADFRHAAEQQAQRSANGHASAGQKLLGHKKRKAPEPPTSIDRATASRGTPMTTGHSAHSNASATAAAAGAGASVSANASIPNASTKTGSRDKRKGRGKGKGTDKGSR